MDLQGRTNLPETISNPNIKLEIERGRALGTLWSLRPKQVLILQEIMLNHPKVTKQSELAEKFAVGRNTINEIINQLSLHGFVQRKKGKPNIYSMELTELVMNLIAESIDEELQPPIEGGNNVSEVNLSKSSPTLALLSNRELLTDLNKWNSELRGTLPNEGLEKTDFNEETALEISSINQQQKLEKIW